MSIVCEKGVPPPNDIVLRLFEAPAPVKEPPRRFVESPPRRHAKNVAFRRRTLFCRAVYILCRLPGKRCCYECRSRRRTRRAAAASRAAAYAEVEVCAAGILYYDKYATFTIYFCFTQCHDDKRVMRRVAKRRRFIMIAAPICLCANITLTLVLLMFYDDERLFAFERY